MTIIDDKTPLKTPMPLRRRIVGVFFFGLLILAVVSGWFSHMMPSPLGAGISLIVGGLAGLYAAWESRDGGLFSPANPAFSTSGRGAWLLTHVALRTPLMGLFCGFIAVTAVEEGLFAMVTAIAGQPASRELIVKGWASGRYSCQRFDVEGAPIMSDQALCADAGRYAAQATPGRPLWIMGKATALGMNVERFELPPAAVSADGP